MNDIITAENLIKYYGNYQALKGISFKIREGECFGFLGHNGAGKSTTMRMIYGLSTVDEGRLTVLGRTIHLTPPDIKKSLGIVPQEDNLDTDLTVLDNLIVYGSFFGLTPTETKERAVRLLSSMGLEEKQDSSVESLSGGLKRRLVIARSLINNPKLVVLDEPTTGLDPQARHLVWQHLRALKNEGITLILTTHYMEEASQLCDRLVIMHQGTILAEGSPRQLVNDYIMPDVIEVHLPLTEIPPNLGEIINAGGGETLRVANGLFLYTNEGQAVWNNLGTWGIPQHVCLLRQANLEDVFLKLTGGKGEEVNELN